MGAIDEDKIMRLKNKVAIITGAASGIGNQIANTFAKEGAKVIIADLDEKKAEEASNAIKKKGFESMALGMDVTDENAVKKGIEKIISIYKTIDILVSNAGIQIISPVEELTLAQWKKLLAIHLDGAFLTTRECLKYMYKNKKGGSIIYMGSVHSKDASVLKAPYVTAKHGLIGLCEVVAKEGIKHNVRANVICPGFVRTPLVEKQIPEQAKDLGISEEEVIKKVMLKDTIDGEFTTAVDIAEIAVLFSSFDSNALTGQSLIVSHGWYMQ